MEIRHECGGFDQNGGEGDLSWKSGVDSNFDDLGRRFIIEELQSFQPITGRVAEFRQRVIEEHQLFSYGCDCQKQDGSVVGDFTHIQNVDLSGLGSDLPD